MLNFSKILTALIFLIQSSFSVAQSNSDSIKIAAQENYSANSIHTFLFGNHWRNIWTTPITAQYLDLNHYAGELRPIKTGGGMQTKSLQLQALNGKIYKFRSVDKYPGRSLPNDFRGSIVESFMQDQITTIHPYSSLVVSSLVKPTGILNSKSELFVMPESSILKEHAQ